MRTLRSVPLGAGVLAAAALGLSPCAAAADGYSVGGWQPLDSVPLYQSQVPGPLTGWVSEPIGVIVDPFLSGRCFPAWLQQGRSDAVYVEATGQALQLPPNYESDDLTIQLYQYNLNTFAVQGPDVSTVRDLVDAIPYLDSACLASEYQQVLSNDMDGTSVQTPTTTVRSLPVGDQAVMSQATTLAPHLSTNPTGVIAPGQLPGNQTTVPAPPADTYVYAEDDVVRVRDGLAELSVFSVGHPFPERERAAILNGLAQRLADALPAAAAAATSAPTPAARSGSTTPTAKTSSSSSPSALTIGEWTIGGLLLGFLGLALAPIDLPVGCLVGFAAAAFTVAAVCFVLWQMSVIPGV
jgi:hypothetical protein